MASGALSQEFFANLANFLKNLGQKEWACAPCAPPPLDPRLRPQPRVSSTQAQWVGQATEQDSSTKTMRHWRASRSYDTSADDLLPRARRCL